MIKKLKTFLKKIIGSIIKWINSFKKKDKKDGND